MEGVGVGHFGLVLGIVQEKTARLFAHGSTCVEERKKISANSGETHVKGGS
jgi:hypothetical protein